MINVIGLGYIGLPTALMLASKGLEVVGTDYNPEVIYNLNSRRERHKKYPTKKCVIMIEIQEDLKWHKLIKTK